MTDKADKTKSFFSLEDTFPDAEGIFTAKFNKLDKSYQNALIVLDTNVLLLPYSMRNEGLEKLRDLYKNLIKDRRLYIPSRVAREFARNRNKKLAEIHNALFQSKTGKKRGIPNYPVLYGLKEKEELEKALARISHQGGTEPKFWVPAELNSARTV